MPSPYWDEARAQAYRRFSFVFPQNTLAGRTIVVAGGSGGLGAATSVLLVRDGANLVIGYKSNRERAEGLRSSLQSQSEARIDLVPGDIAEPGVRMAYASAIAAQGSPLAGAAIFPGDPARVTFENLDQPSLEASLRVNYTGPLLLAKDLGEMMEHRPEGGSIVFLATMQVLAAFPSSINYAAPKAALVHAARVLAQQWNSVRVNVVAPGATIAGMAAASVESGKYDRYIQNHAIARFGRPEDVARAVRFFLEPDCYITGQALAVDGGLVLRRDR